MSNIVYFLVDSINNVSPNHCSLNLTLCFYPSLPPLSVLFVDQEGSHISDTTLLLLGESILPGVSHMV